jgi:hypothetical protein
MSQFLRTSPQRDQKEAARAYKGCSRFNTSRSWAGFMAGGHDRDELVGVRRGEWMFEARREHERRFSGSGVG